MESCRSRRPMTDSAGMTQDEEIDFFDRLAVAVGARRARSWLLHHRHLKEFVVRVRMFEYIQRYRECACIPSLSDPRALDTGPGLNDNLRIP